MTLPAGVREHAERRADEHGRHDREAVEAVGQIHAVAGKHEHERREQHVADGAERDADAGDVRNQQRVLDGRVLGRDVERDREPQRADRLPEELRADAQALRVAQDDFLVVVDEADDAEEQRAAEREQHEPVAQVRPQQRADRDREQDQRAAHRRRAGLRKMALGTDLANLLADALHLQALDQVRPERERQHERRQRAQDRARRQVAEDVEARVELRQVVGDVDQHQLALVARSRAFARGGRGP